jgi:hypothetical protein
MYCCPEGNEEHVTTYNILKRIVEPKEGILYSLDIDSGHIDFSQEYCKDVKAICVYVEGDSVVSLEHLSLTLEFGTAKFDLLCLDSKDFDEDHMVNEYNAISGNLSEAHYVLVDDIHNPNSVKYKKMVPELVRLGYETLEISTPTGMLIATKGLPLPGNA